MKDLTKYNYDDLVEKATNALKDKEGWGDAYQSSVGQTLIQLLADTTDNLHYLLERRSIEGFIKHARLDTSVISRASELGYRPYRARAHTGTIEVTLIDEDGEPTSAVFEAFLPKHTQFVSLGRTFHTTRSATIRGDQTSVEIPVIEGVYEEHTYQLRDLNDMNEIVIRDWEQIDENYIDVTIGGNEWKDVRGLSDVNKRALSFLGRTDRMYDIKYSTEGMSIVFGDGWFGAEPNGPITIGFVRVRQVTNTEVYTLNSEFDLIDELSDRQSPSIIYEVDAKNITTITGGGERESIDSIRQNATTYNRTNGRGTTNSDYSFWARKSGVSRIADARAYGEEEINTFIYNANNVYITYATPDYSNLTLPEVKKLRSYMDNIKTSQAHIVIKPANVYQLVTNTSVRKYANVPISDAHTYHLIHKFLSDKFSVKDGSIGLTLHDSDVVNDFYGIRFNDSGVTKPLVDFVKWDMKIGIEYSFPSPVRSTIVGIRTNEFESLIAGKEWIIVVNGTICKVVVVPDDSPAKLMMRMRDVIMSITDLEVGVILDGALVDENGNFVGVGIGTDIGYHLEPGVNTTSTVIDPVITPEQYTIYHRYYSPTAGYRPIIPIRASTTVTYTAPSDTAVEVWIKESHKAEDPYDMVRVLARGEKYTETFTEDKLLRFRLSEDSLKDTVVTVEYTSWIGSRLGLKLTSINQHNDFNVYTGSGDFSSGMFVDYHVLATRPPEKVRAGVRLIEPGSVEILDQYGEVVAVDLGDGTFDASDGYINYNKGIISPPSATHTEDKFLVTYKQDEFSNIQMGRGDILKLADIPQEIDGTTVYGKITVV